MSYVVLAKDVSLCAALVAYIGGQLDAAEWGVLAHELRRLADRLDLARHGYEAARR